MTIEEYQGLALECLDSIAKLCARAPEDQLDWRPLDNCMTLGQLLDHLATSLTPMVVMAVTGEMGTAEEQQAMMQAVMKGEQLKRITPAEAQATVAQQKQDLIDILATVSDEDWRNLKRTMPWGTTASISGHAGGALDHASGHRYQLFMYLKLLGQPLGTMELYGMG